ncbi:MAG: cation:proton antiporter [Alphaproteobacteria bacterium]|nr:cation:proton antiporter [Alphaproteobacteria bacterium]MCB9795769.1 cation:proton antiporter [Alphaproteobacteria bacterium]
MAGGGHEPMRLDEALLKLGIVGGLFGVMHGLKALELDGGQGNTVAMVTFGFIILAAYTLGEVMEKVGLPHITAYLLTGLVLGPEAAHVLHLPEVLALISEDTVKDLKLFNDIAVALIALSAGSSLELPALRKSLRLLMSLLVTQFLVLWAVLGGLVMLISGPIEGFSLEFLASQPFESKMAAALLLALVGSAMSPAASIAIIQETRSKGPVTDATLGVSVLNNVFVVMFFVVGFSMALGMVSPESASEGSLLVELGVKIGGAALLGALLGLGVALYIRFVGQEMLLVLAGLCFAITYLARANGVDPLLAFLAAGFFVRNFTAAGPALKNAINILSMPIYVVFFFIAGAGLHLHDLVEMFEFALLLFAGRWFALWASTSLGTRLGAGPPKLAKIGWLGFGAQAGIALAMADAVAAGLPGLGGKIYTLGVAGIALNEMLGPVALKVALSKVGEAASEEQAPVVDDDPSVYETEISEEVTARLPEWLPEPGHRDFDPWGPLPLVSSRRLLETSRNLRADLQGLVRDVRAGPIAQRRDIAHQFLGRLRREFLRHHRRIVVQSKDPELSPSAFTAELRRGPARLARSWEDHILDRAAVADFQAEQRTLDDLIRLIDRLAEGLPQATEIAFDVSLLNRREVDSTRVQLGKALLRARHALGMGPEHRVVEVRPLGRYALSGLTPQHLPELAGMMALSERHLLARARNVFESYRRGVDQLLAHPDFTPETWTPLLERFREELEEEFALANREVDRLADETVRVTASVLGRPYQRFNEMLVVAGTPELPAAEYRFSRVYNGRVSALEEMSKGLRDVRELTRAEANGLAMELQLVRLRASIQRLTEEKADGIARDIRGRLSQPVRRVNDTLLHTTESLSACLAVDGVEGAALAERVRQAAQPLARVVDEAQGITASLRNSLRSQATLEPLRQGLSRGFDGLTDRFVIVTNSPGVTGRRLPPAPITREVSFRELAAQYLDTEINLNLAQTLDDLVEKLDSTYRTLDELQRSLGFNMELTLAELDVLPPGPAPESAREVVSEMLLGTLQRLGNRVHQLSLALDGIDVHTAQAIRDTVLGQIDSFQALLIGGRLDELRLRLVRGQVARRRQLITGGASNLTDLGQHVQGGLVRVLGDEGYHRLRESLGLPDASATQELCPAAFAPPKPQVELPVVFKRLFSDAALEAGDLLTGREREVDDVRRILLGEAPGVSRAVAVIGVGGVGQGAVINALLRGLGDRTRLIRHELHAPVRGPAEVDALLERVTEDCIVVVEGLQWLFAIEPGGFSAVRRFVQRVVEDRGRNAWLISAERPVWAYADRVVALHDAFPERVLLEPLDTEGLRRAILDRHAMSGYGLRFSQPQPTAGHWLRETVLGREADDHTLEAEYFKRLHSATGGVLSDALRLWMASVQRIDDDRGEIVVGEVPRTPIKLLRRLPEDVLMTLRQAARQGRLTAKGHAAQFRMEEDDSEAVLARLTHWGLLERGERGEYHFASGLGGPLYRVLLERRLVG